MKFIRFLLAWGEQVFVASDQWVNATLMPMFTWSIGFSDETLSARCWRSRNHLWAKLFMPVINALFIWQGPDHCHMAYIKEMERRNLPPEYRESK